MAMEGADLNVLIIEDNPADVRFVREMLDAEGCGVEIVASGKEALKRIETRPVDLVLLGDTLPDMDGHALTAEIRKTRSGSDLPIIMMADPLASNIAVEALEAGANDSFMKPVNDELVRARVRAHLELKDTVEQLERANRTIEEQAHHLQMVMDGATTAIFSLNTQGKVMSANQMTAVMTGRPIADLIGTPFANLVDGDDPTEAEALVAMVIEDGYLVSNHETKVRRADGSLRTVILSMRALTRDGEIASVAGIANDVTELRKQREELSSHLRMLEAPGPSLQSLLAPEASSLPTESDAQIAVAETGADTANLDQMDWNEQRAHPRHKVYKAGKISFNNESSIVDCIVRDQSEGGARLEFQTQFNCPRFIILRISDGEANICEVRQFANNVMGVKFLG